MNLYTHFQQVCIFYRLLDCNVIWYEEGYVLYKTFPQKEENKAFTFALIKRKLLNDYVDFPVPPASLIQKFTKPLL